MRARAWQTLAVVLLLSFGAARVQSAAASEKKYPTRPITLVSAFPPGGVADLTSRIWGKYLEKQLGVPVVPDNKPGGGGVVLTTYLANARPDGYTLGNAADFMLTGILMGQATYKMEDLRVIAEIARNGCVLVVPTDSPYRTIHDLVSAAKANPGIKYAHPGAATIVNLRMLSLNKFANLRMVPLPLKGDMEVLTSVMGKHVPVGLASAFAAQPQVEAGKLRILFSFDPPAEIGLPPSIPDLDTVFGKDAPDITVSVYLVAPAKTPPDVIETLEKAAEKMAKDPEFIAELKKSRMAVRYVDGKTVMEKRIPWKMQELKTLMKDAGVLDPQ
ncbi:MAG: tripartite tricarboxylate transporter substrate binding protein [Deltaproteobacteria bacterium]|nr:tripartite tricarboxylate transporter substrate binding protein [Deltaproteobacteria bacterium]